MTSQGIKHTGDKITLLSHLIDNIIKFLLHFQTKLILQWERQSSHIVPYSKLKISLQSTMELPSFAVQKTLRETLSIVIIGSTFTVSKISTTITAVYALIDRFLKISQLVIAICFSSNGTTPRGNESKRYGT